MDIAARIKKIMNNNNGTLVFSTIAEPTTGFATVSKIITYDLVALDPTATTEAIRAFLVNYLFRSDGVCVFKRSGFMNLCTVKVYPTLIEATNNARISGIAWIVDLSTKTVTQVGDFQPIVTGDGDV